MAWNATDIPPQPGRVAVITGANGGLGLESARALARKAAHVVMAARNLDKAESARASILAETPDASLEVRALDLASLASIDACARDILDSHPRVDLLINNAGVMAVPEGKTEDGFEMQFGVNHLGHFALTRHLLPALLAAPAARVVTVTSTARLLTTSIDLANPHLTGRYDPWRAYGQSKLANLHFAVELQRRLEAVGAAVASLAAHPGLSNTDLQSNTVRVNEGGLGPRFWETLAHYTGMPPERGALPQLRAATDPAAKGGDLYAPRYVNFGPPVRRPILSVAARAEDTAALWGLSERETGVAFDVEALVRDQAA